MTTLSYTVNMKAQCDDGYQQNVSSCCYVNSAFCVNRLRPCLYWPVIGSDLVSNEAQKEKDGSLRGTLEACRTFPHIITWIVFPEGIRKAPLTECIN